jgi:hypothetical protein
LHDTALRQKLTDLVALMQVGEATPDSEIIAVYHQCVKAREVAAPQLAAVLEIDGGRLSTVQSNNLYQAMVQLDSMPTSTTSQIYELTSHVNAARKLIVATASTL